MLQRIGARIGATIGRELMLVRTVRPAYEALLDLATPGRGFTRTVNGTDTFYVNPRVRGLFPETYERDVWSYLRARIEPGHVVLDVGAHVGLSARGAAAWSAPNGRVIAFEPNPRPREILAGHVRRNGLSDPVEAVLTGPTPPEIVVEFHPHLWKSAKWDRHAIELLLAGFRRVPVPLTGQKDLWIEPGVVLLAREDP